MTLRLRRIVDWMRRVFLQVMRDMRRDLERLELLVETDDDMLCRLMEVADHYNLVRHAYENGGAADTNAESIPYSD